MQSPVPGCFVAKYAFGGGQAVEPAAFLAPPLL